MNENPASYRSSSSGLLQQTPKLRVAPHRALRFDLVIDGEKRVSMSTTSLHEQIATALVDNAVNDGFHNLHQQRGGDDRQPITE